MALKLHRLFTNLICCVNSHNSFNVLSAWPERKTYLLRLFFMTGHDMLALIIFVP